MDEGRSAGGFEPEAAGDTSDDNCRAAEVGHGFRGRKRRWECSQVVMNVAAWRIADQEGDVRRTRADRQSPDRWDPNAVSRDVVLADQLLVSWLRERSRSNPIVVLGISEEEFASRL